MNFWDRVMTLIFQNFCKIFTWLVFNTVYRTTYINGRNIPRKGGFVLAPNHSCFWDPPLIGSVTSRGFGVSWPGTRCLRTP